MNIPQETRRQAYEETRKMASSRRFEILKLLAAKNRPLSSRELAYLLGFHDCNATRPRLTEMEKRGWVHIVGKGHCSTTGKPVSLYEITDAGREKVRKS